VSFAIVTLCIASQQVFVVVYFITSPVQKLMGTPSYVCILKEMTAVSFRVLSEHSPGEIEETHKMPQFG
jgi:hypothetical protein